MFNENNSIFGLNMGTKDFHGKIYTCIILLSSSHCLTGMTLSFSSFHSFATTVATLLAETFTLARCLDEFHVVKGVKLFYHRSSVDCLVYLWYMYQGESLLPLFLSVVVTYLRWNYLYVGIPSNLFIIIEFPFNLSIYAGCQLWSYIGL